MRQTAEGGVSFSPYKFLVETDEYASIKQVSKIERHERDFVDQSIVFCYSNSRRNDLSRARDERFLLR
jgi:hypothetical protein